MPGEMGRRRRLPVRAPPSPQGGDCSKTPHGPGACEPCLPTGVPKRNYEGGAKLRQTPARSRAWWRVCQRRMHAPAHGGNGRNKCQVEGKAVGPIQLAGRFLRDVGPSHDCLRGARTGEATNPELTKVLPPWQPDPEYLSNFAMFGKGWIAFVFLGPIDVCGPLLSFRVKAPSGDKLATLFIAGDCHIFSDLREGQAYVCAEAKPILPSDERPTIPRGAPGLYHGRGWHPYGPVWPSLENGGPQGCTGTLDTCRPSVRHRGIHRGDELPRCVHRLGL